MIKTRAIIDTHALLHNMQQVKKIAPDCPLMAVIKADAYGHGAVGLLQALQQHADALAVARLEEARALRSHGFAGRLLLLAGVSNHTELKEALRLQLDMVVHDIAHLVLFANHTASSTDSAHLWLKMDTGMHRLGFAPDAFAQALVGLRALSWCRSVTGMTHFSSSDDLAKDKTNQQLACFQQHSQELVLDGVSLANSAGLLAWPAARQGWLRPGLMLYGVNPLDEQHYPTNLLPVMQLEAQVIGTKTIEAGETVGYNDTWRATRTTTLAFIAAGYADGYPITWHQPAVVAYQSQLLPVVGRVSMDTIAVDCTGITPPTMSEWVELWGKTVSVKALAANAGTIPYQLLTNVSSRVKRVYL